MRGSIAPTPVNVVWWQSACVSYVCKYERQILYDTKVAQTLKFVTVKSNEMFTSRGPTCGDHLACDLSPFESVTMLCPIHT